MKGFDIDKLIIVSLGGKTGRFNYFLSLLIIVVGFYYFFEHYDPNTCHVCFPIMRFPWGELVGSLFILALGGFYSCFLFCLLATDERYCDGPIVIPILFQSIRHCLFFSCHQKSRLMKNQKEHLSSRCYGQAHGLF